MNTILLAALGAGLALAGFVAVVLWVWPRARRWSAARSRRPAVVVQADPLTRWEEAALLTTGAASAFNVLLWALGVRLADAVPGWSVLGALRVAFGALSFVSMDLVVVVVVMAMRAGRRGLWSEAAAAGAALVAAMIALEVAGVPDPSGLGWSWLHAGPAAVLYTLVRHLATPRAALDADQLVRDLAEARARADRAEREADQQRARADEKRDLANILAGELDQLRAAPALTDGAGDLLDLGGRTVPVRRLVQELERAGHAVPRSTLNRAAARAAGQGEE